MIMILHRAAHKQSMAVPTLELLGSCTVVVAHL